MLALGALLLVLLHVLGADGVVARGSLEPPLAIEGVTVVTMTGPDAVLADRTVLVSDGRIVAIGARDEVEVPEGALRIDGHGRFLLPGLVDMHCHLLSDERIADSYADEELAVVVANGVTTIRIPIGKREHLALRERVRRGEVLGPRLWVGSPQVSGRALGALFNGVELKDPKDAREAVERFHEQGYDFVKLTFFVSRPVFDAVAERAGELGMPVIGHVGPEVGLASALAARVQIEHLDQYLEALLPDDAPKKESLSGMGVWTNWDTVGELDATRIPALVSAIVEAGVWSTPTLAFLDGCFGEGRGDEEVDASPDARFVSSEVRAELLANRDLFWGADPPSAEARARFVELRGEIVRQLAAAGGKLLAGSDSPEWLLLYGFTLHRELERLVRAGLAPYQALEAATRNPAEWLGVLDEAGTVEVGKRADLVLLEANPLEDIRNTTRIEGVVVGGHWLARADLTALLERAASILSKAPLRPEHNG
jgi:hypothetical protein